MDDYDDEDPLAEKFLEYLKDRNYIVSCQALRLEGSVVKVII